jgi:hypothetical protein
LRTEVAIVVVMAFVLSGGCRTDGTSPKAAGKSALQGARVLLTVDFEPGRTLTYKFVSYRDITLDWDPGAAASANKMQKQSERLEMVVAYTPIEVDPYGVSTVRAACQSVEVTRTRQPSGRGLDTDAVEKAQGRTFTIKVDPRGKIVDASDLDRLIREMGVAAFRPNPSRGRIKEPDLIGDFIASQWFLWDAVSSIETPAAGVAVGQTWQSTLSVPTPMVMRKARDVTYRLDDVRRTEEGLVAEIGSTYSLADAAPSDWPIPYSGRFQVSGTFGFLGAYDVSKLEGSGCVLFNVDAGRIEREDQKYVLQMKASLPPMGIRANPLITIEQTLTMELLDPEAQP